MSDLSTLLACLKNIDASARDFVILPANAQTRGQLASAMAVATPVLERHYDLETIDRERNRIARGLGAFRSAMAAMDADQSSDRHRLILSYVRSMRSHIARLQPLLEAHVLDQSRL